MVRATQVTVFWPPVTVISCSGELLFPREIELIMEMLASTTVISSSTKLYLTPLKAWNEK